MKTPSFSATSSRRSFISHSLLASASPFLPCMAPAAEIGFFIGAYTRAWGKRDYREALDGMATCGFLFAGLSVDKNGRVIDRDTSLEDAAKIGVEVTTRGLRIATLSAGSFETDQPPATGVAQLRHLVDLAVACGAPALQVNDPAKADVEDAFYQVVAECCDYAAEKKVALNIHPHGSSGAHIRARIDAINHSNLRLMYDPGNVGYYSEGAIDPVRDAEALDGVVFGISIKDFDLPKNVNINPGSGRVDFPGLIARLRQGGFTGGPVVIECLQPGELEEVNAAARQAREMIESLLG
jgi:sugar phosphate isomerase/epimerase